MWDFNVHIVKHITKVQKEVDILPDQAKITTDKGELLNDLLYTIRESEEIKQALVDWDAKIEADQTWKKAKACFTKEYANQNKHATIEAMQAGFDNLSANQVREEEQEIKD